MVSEFGSGQSALSLVYDSGWCNLWAYYIYDNIGWADRLIHSDLLPGSNARWCVENWPTAVTLDCHVCDCHLSSGPVKSPVTGLCDCWKLAGGQLLVLDPRANNFLAGVKN